MSIRVATYQDALERRYFTVVTGDDEQSFKIHYSSNIISIQQDFEGRVKDEHKS